MPILTLPGDGIRVGDVGTLLRATSNPQAFIAIVQGARMVHYHPKRTIVDVWHGQRSLQHWHLNGALADETMYDEQPSAHTIIRATAKGSTAWTNMT